MELTTLKPLSRLNKCCPALIYLSVKNNQIQDVREIEHLCNLRLKGFDIEGNPIRASPEEINRVIRKTFPLIITGKLVRFAAFDRMSMQMLPPPKFNTIKQSQFPQTVELTTINSIAEHFMKLFIFNRFGRQHIDENYDPNATVSVIEDRMYARNDLHSIGRKWFYLNKDHIKGPDNISKYLSQKLRGRFPITSDCYIVDYMTLVGNSCMLIINGFVRQHESAFTRSIVFYVNNQGKNLILNDTVNIWKEYGPNIISFVNPSSAVSNKVTMETASALISTNTNNINNNGSNGNADVMGSQLLAQMNPEEAKFVQGLSVKSGLPISVIIDYITNFGKTKEQAESDFSDPMVVNQIKELMKFNEIKHNAEVQIK